MNRRFPTLVGRWCEGIPRRLRNLWPADHKSMPIDVAALEDRTLYSASPMAMPAAESVTMDAMNDVPEEASGVSSWADPMRFPQLAMINAAGGEERVKLDDPVTLSGEPGAHVELADGPELNLRSGTIALSFTTDDVSGRQALFSKDASGYENGGHLTAMINEGRIEVRLQSTDRSVWLKSPSELLEAGQEHHLAVTFGSDGFWLYLNGQMQDWNTEFDQGIKQNERSLLIGANGWSRTDDPNKVCDFFQGTIDDFTVYGRQLAAHEIADLAGFVFEPERVEGRTDGTDVSESLTGTDLFGGYGDDQLTGTDQGDRLDGGAGDDLLVSRSDGREARIAQNYGPDDDPHGEIDRRTRTYYADQPIEADDVLVGGEGADTFRFEVLINAKRNIILQHVNDDRTIDWMGVAGENQNVHDHWVDRLGDEVIEDFRRSEGDQIEIVGHTVDLHKIAHIDTNQDNVVDATRLYLQSNQGSGGGAHNRDQLGTITVFGDLVTREDILVDPRPAYGIVQMIDELEEAMHPRVGTPVALDGSPPPYPTVPAQTLPLGCCASHAGTDLTCRR